MMFEQLNVRGVARPRAARWSAGVTFALVVGATTSPRAQTPVAAPPPVTPPVATAPPPTEPLTEPPPPSAEWQSQPPAVCACVPGPGAETHDHGYVRLQLGINSSVFRAKAGGQTTTVSGEGGSMAVALGWTVAPNLALYGQLLDAGAGDFDLQSGSQTTFVKGNSDLYGIGPGVTYYLPSNVFVSATVMAARIFVTDANDHTLMSSGWGVAGDAVLGKEWWASDNWGLGVSLQGILGAMGGSSGAAGGVSQSWRASAWSLLFSATYN
jgi:hypothetical protein